MTKMIARECAQRCADSAYMMLSGKSRDFKTGFMECGRGQSVQSAYENSR